MADETTVAATATEAATTPATGITAAQAATTSEGATPAQVTTTQATTATTKTVAELMAELDGATKRISELNKENEKNRKAEKAKTDAELTEAQREKARADEAEKQRDEAIAYKHSALLSSTVTRIAGDAKVGAIRPASIARLIDQSKVTFEGDEVKGVEAEVARIKTEFPELFHKTPGSADGGAGATNAATFDGNAMIRRMAGRA